MAEETVLLELPPELYAQLRARATEAQTDLVDIIARLLAQTDRASQTEHPSHALQRIAERATDLGLGDLAEQHDHYLYGVDKS